MKLAGIGRNIAMGRGVTSATESPCFLDYHSPISNYFPPQPPSIYYWIQVACFKIGGYKDSSAVLAGGAFFMAASLLTYVLARRLYPRKVALFIFFFAFTDPVLLRSSINGLPTAFLSFLAVLIFYGLEVLPGRYAAGWGGIILGLGFLSDYSWSVLLIPVLRYFVVFNRKDWLANVGIFLAGFIVVISPWLFGEIRAGGSSYFINLDLLWKSSTELFPAQSARGLYGISFRTVYLTIPMIIGKIHHGLSLLYREGLIVSGNVLGLLFWASLFYKASDERLRRYRWLLCLLLGGSGIWSVITGHHTQVLRPFLPLIILFGTGFFLNLIRHFGLLSPRTMNEVGLDPTGQWRKVYLNKSLPGKSPLEQVMLLPGRLVLMGKRTILLNRISSRW